VTGLFGFRLRFLTDRVSSCRFFPVAPTSDRAWIYSARVFFSLPRNQGLHRGSLFFIRAAHFGLNRALVAYSFLLVVFDPVPKSLCSLSSVRQHPADSLPLSCCLCPSGVRLGRLKDSSQVQSTSPRLQFSLL
jgi:hypothetical protein